MFNLATIKAMNGEAAREARREGKQPFLVECENDKERLREIPNIGSLRPKGWKLVDTLFVDSSGFGAEDEPAMTFGQFVQRVRVGYGYALIECGQFQVRIGEFERCARGQTLAAFDDRKVSMAIDLIDEVKK